MSASKWRCNPALLRDELGDHVHEKLRSCLKPRPEGMLAAYGVLWAAYEDALKGDLKPGVKETGKS